MKNEWSSRTWRETADRYNEHPRKARYLRTTFRHRKQPRAPYRRRTILRYNTSMSYRRNINFQSISGLCPHAGALPDSASCTSAIHVDVIFDMAIALDLHIKTRHQRQRKEQITATGRIVQLSWSWPLLVRDMTVIHLSYQVHTHNRIHRVPGHGLASDQIDAGTGARSLG